MTTHSSALQAVSAPSILYLPASGPGGAGEYFRCLTLARALQDRWPNSRATFMLNRHASYAHEVPFPVELIDSTPTHATSAVNACIRRLRPDIVLFDNAGRAAQLQMAKTSGATTILVTSRPNARRKGLRLQRVRYLDQHWIVQPEWAMRTATPWERIKKRYFSHMQTLQLDTLFEEGTPEQGAALKRRLALEGQSYVAFCVGGGGRFHSGPSASEVFLAAASSVAQHGGFRCVVVLGPNHALSEMSGASVISVAQLPNAELMQLIRDATLVICGGGALLIQVLALNRPCVGVAIAGDQSARLERCRELGLLEVADCNAQAISSAVLRVLDNAPQRQAMVTRSSALGLKNGMPQAVQAIEAIMRQRAGATRCEGGTLHV